MTENTPAMQTVALDNPTTACLFDADGNPFYKVEGIAYMLTQNIARRVVHLDENSTDTDRAYMMGQVDLVEHIAAQATALKGLYQAQATNTVEDFLKFANGKFE